MSREKLIPLEQLQKIDLQIEALLKDAEAGPSRVAALEAVAAKARAAADTERGKVADNERARRHLEALLTEEKDKVKKWEARLTQLKHPREFAALEREINGSKNANETTEEELTRLLLELDPIKASLAVKEAELSVRDAELAKEKAAVAAAQGDFNARIETLQGERERERAQVDVKLYGSYENVRKRRGGRVLVAIASGTCLGCNRKLAPQIVNRLLNGAVEPCPSCMRIVYAPREVPEAFGVMPSEEPSFEDVLRAVAAECPLDRVAAKLGISPQRVAELVGEAADALQWRIPARAARGLQQASAQPQAPTVRDRPAVMAKASEEKPAEGKWSRLVLYSDGAARGNPGPAGAGAVLKAPDGQIVARLGKFLGTQTNNVAEYQGVLIGLTRALELGVRQIDVRADSLLVISQLRGEWKVKNEGLRPLYLQAKALLGKFERSTLAHVPREQNGDADEMSNRAIDERM